MKIIDISWPISEQITAYKNRSTVHVQQTKKFSEQQVRESLLTLGAHTGTHVDAPSHFLMQGDTIEAVSLHSLIGPASVIDLTHVSDKITPTDLVDAPIEKDKIVLLKTKNSAFKEDAPFDPEFVYLTGAAAQYLVSKQVRAVGIDYLGIERNQPGHETHTIFFSSSIPIIEGLRLVHVAAGEYWLFCLPLLWVGIEAAPARAILIDNFLENIA